MESPVVIFMDYRIMGDMFQDLRDRKSDPHGGMHEERKQFRQYNRR